MTDVDVRFSKLMAYFLRYGAVQEGLDPDSNGWISIDKIAQHPKVARHMDRDTCYEMLTRVCGTSMSAHTGQPRFSLDGEVVRANYMRKFRATDWCVTSQAVELPVVLERLGSEEAEHVAALHEALSQHPGDANKQAAAESAIELTSQVEVLLESLRGTEVQGACSQLFAPLCIAALTKTVKQLKSLEGVKSAFMRKQLFHSLALQRKLSNPVLRLFLDDHCTELNWADQYVTDSTLGMISKRCPNLELLDLSGVLFPPSLLRSVLTKCRKLQTLRMRRCPNLNATSLELIAKCDTLTSLDISGCKQLEDDWLQCFRGCSSLSSLSLEGTKLTNEAIAYLPVGLQSLYLRRNSNMWGDVVCVVLTTKLPNLVAVDLRHVPGLSNGGLCALREGIEHLRLLKPCRIVEEEDLSVSDVEEDDSCVICLDNACNVTINPCGHDQFCEDCIKALVENSCPLCRGAVVDLVVM